MMAVGAIVGSVSSYVGLLISYHFDVAAGATMVLVASAIFFAVLAATNVRDRLTADGLEPDAPATGAT
jgi:ABC-type Mn2+/Zn2+ transport system permease subunit